MFQGSSISSDGDLLFYRELDDTLWLTDVAAEPIADLRTGKNGRHRLAGFLRQSVFSRLAGYEDVNDADRLCRNPKMRQLVGGRAVKMGAASASAMGWFETEMLTRPENLSVLADLSSTPSIVLKTAATGFSTSCRFSTNDTFATKLIGKTNSIQS